MSEYSTWPQHRIHFGAPVGGGTRRLFTNGFVNRDQEQWEAITSKENLDINIIDVYAEWCGPCKSIPQGARSALHIRQRLS